MRQAVAWLAGLLLAAAAASAVWAQDCSFWLQLNFRDGQTACLTDYPLAAQVPAGRAQRLDKLIPSTARYALAATVGRRDRCPLQVGLELDTSATAGDPARVVLREERAVHQCTAARPAGAPDVECRCALVVTDGSVALPKRVFDQWFSAGEQAAAPSVQDAGRRAQQEEQLARARQRVQEMQERLASAQVPRPTPESQPPPSARPMRARALVIGNSRYAHFGVLANPGNDARAIAAKLRGFGIEVDLLIDAERDQLIHGLNEHLRKAQGSDLSLLFYAGHGVQLEGINYLIPVNMRADGITPGYVKLAGVSLNAALDYLPGRMRIVFLDACRDNPASRSLVATRSAASGGLAPMDAASGTLLSFATRHGATAEDGDGANSPYTTALLRHLDTPADLSLVLRDVRQTVLALTGGRQEPWEYGSLLGDEIVLPAITGGRSR